VAREQARDPDNAAREYGARFMTSGTTVFFEAATVDVAVTEEAFVVQPGDVLAAGSDFGFRSDSSALLMVALRGNTIHVFDGLEARPEPDAPLKPSTTVSSFAAKIAGRCAYVVADNHYREAIAELLEQHGLHFVPAPTTPADTYVRARMLLREQRVRVHPLPFRDRLLQQMREVQGKPTSGGGMSIVHPRWSKGGHGDLVAALVLALWQVTGDEVAKPPPAQGTDEWALEQKRARYEHYKQLEERPYWKRGESQGRFWRR
jgi:hypothetical protein